MTSVLDGVTDPRWLADARRAIAADPAAIAGLFPAAGRRCGRGPLPAGAERGPLPPGRQPGPLPAAGPGWTVDDAVRLLLLQALPLRGAALAEQVRALYRYGDAAERRAVLRALPLLDIGDRAADLLRDAIRTNDPRLIAAAMGEYASHLDPEMWRQGVLKCVFMEIPLAAVAGLAGRADAELGRMLASLAAERRAAGRTMPADATALLADLDAGLGADLGADLMEGG